MRIFCRCSLFDIGSAVADAAAIRPITKMEVSTIIIRFMAISSLFSVVTHYDVREVGFVDMKAGQGAWGKGLGQVMRHHCMHVACSMWHVVRAKRIRLRKASPDKWGMGKLSAVSIGKSGQCQDKWPVASWLPEGNLMVIIR
jgi:hypothetical protein